MASNEEEHETDKFIRPIQCLYSDYATTIDKFKEEHGVLLTDYELEDLGEDAEYKLYAEFVKDGDGELARELVQTWICDNRLEITNCIHLALNNRKQAFCDWFRDSEQYTSPTNYSFIAWEDRTNYMSVSSMPNTCGQHWRTIYGMTILKFLNIVKLSLFISVNVTMQSSVRRGFLFTKNPYLIVTKHRAVEVKVVDVEVILGRQLRRKLCVDPQIKNTKVSAQLVSTLKH